MNRIFFVLLLCFITFVARADGSRYASQSVLSEGRWVKIHVSKDGIYKLTYADLRKMGFSDPAKVSVHGYGGWIMDEDFSKNTYIDDVPAVAVWRGSDYILFYGKGPVKWSYDSVNSRFVHENNPYSLHGYYFVTDATETNDMKTVSSVDGASLQISTFDDYQVYELDEVSIKDSGRDLFGESFEGRSSISKEFQVPGITDDEGLVTIRLMCGGTGYVTSDIDGFLLGNNEYITGSFDAYTKGVSFLRATKWTGSKSEQPKVTLTYSPTGQKTYLDYIRLQMKRQLQSYGEACTFFRSLSARGNVSRFNIRNATADMMVFEVTDGFNPVRMETTLTGSELSFTVSADASLREFVLVDPSKSFLTPVQVGVVQSQNLHALPQTEMVILAPSAFVSEAERLAAHHRSVTQLSVEVVTPEQVYNEFSSGTPDATAIRRFMKMFYDRRSSDADAPRFLLLFGDGSYDNRKLTSTWKGVSMDNFILTYQTTNSQDAGSCVIEDYFGLLSDAHHENMYNLDLHLGIGRFPVRTVAQAKAAVDKVINYALNQDAGSWKNLLCFVADDGSNSDGFMTDHMNQANKLSDTIEANYPAYLMNKQFFDAYKKSSVAGKMGYPDVEANIIKQLKEGALIINYTGHGNSTSWSDEQVVTNSQIQSYTYKHLPLWVTATCDFTPFDAYQTSAGENVFLNEKSGGIALYTTTRVAYSGSNFSLNMLLLKKIFERKSNGERLTLGEAIRATKQEYRFLDRVRFMLIGDPALTLTFPEYELKITEINGEPVGNNPIEFKALERITVKGEVYDETGSKATGFNGSFSANIMDSQETVTTLDNNSTGKTFEYQDYRSSLQKVNEEITNGEFSFSFVVPSFISYSGLAGKISMYALDETTHTEANGAFKNFTVGGTAPNPEFDTDGPEIRAVYLNDSTFRDGDKVNDTPFFIAELWDKSGVYIGGSSLGHDMILTIDNNPNYSYNLNAYYQTLSGGSEGVVRFPVPTLSEGLHTATFKVFDVLANSSTYTFTFEVVSGLKPAIADLRAAPSPARESVTFMLTHNRPESDMEVTIRVYNLTGQLEWENTEKGSSEVFKTYNVTWDLTNGSGSRLRPGIYIYRAGIRTGNSSEATKAKKLVVLGR
jgi:hypothetical protein